MTVILGDPEAEFHPSSNHSSQEVEAEFNRDGEDGVHPYPSVDPLMPWLTTQSPDSSGTSSFGILQEHRLKKG